MTDAPLPPSTSCVTAKRYARRAPLPLLWPGGARLTALFLVVLLVDIVIKGLPAFWEHQRRDRRDGRPPPTSIPAKPAGGRQFRQLIQRGLPRRVPGGHGPRRPQGADRRCVLGRGRRSARSMVMADPVAHRQDRHRAGAAVATTPTSTSRACSPTSEDRAGQGHAARRQARRRGGLRADRRHRPAKRPRSSWASQPATSCASRAARCASTACRTATSKADPVLPPDADVHHGSFDAGQWDIVSFSMPEANRRISDAQALWLDQLKQEGRIENAFTWRFFESGDSREPELAGIRGALVGSLLTLLVTLLARPAARRRGGDLPRGVRAQEPLDRPDRGQHQQPRRRALDRLRPARPRGVPQLLRPAALGAAGRRPGAGADDAADHHHRHRAPR